MSPRARRRRRRLASGLVSLALLPLGWPHHLLLGVSDGPGDARALVARTHVDARYQYLAGGVNTGRGWATWDPRGTFASRYVRESLAAHLVPVLTLYQLLQSAPAVPGGEAVADVAHLRDPAVMHVYWADYRLLLGRVAAAAGSHLAVIHVEPDLWGYLEAMHATRLARAFAERLVALRDRLAPHVALAWHLSAWGTGEDPTYSKPSLAHMSALAHRSAAFLRALRTRFDLVFTDVSDRDADFYRIIEGNPRTWWSPADFARHDRYLATFTRLTGTRVVEWQVPLGNTGLPDRWGRFRDDRVQWWLGPRAHLRAERAAGVVGLLFGGGADGTTSETSDGGLFDRLARRYIADPLGL